MTSPKPLNMRQQQVYLLVQQGRRPTEISRIVGRHVTGIRSCLNRLRAMGYDVPDYSHKKICP